MEEKYKEIINFLKDYQKQTGVRGYVLGVSGGKDSTITARILCDAIGKENVLGVLMPNGEQKDISDSIEVCKLLDIDYIEVNIKSSYNCILSQIQNAYPSNYTEMLPVFDKEGNVLGYEPKYPISKRVAETENGIEFQISEKAKSNIAPRLRMTTLYAIAQTLGYRVCGTGNASEIYVGWFTKWGDGASDINPIAHLTCTEVIALGDYLGLPEHLVHKTPADGITGKSDEENLGITYQQLDLYIKSWYNGETIALPYDIIAKIGRLHKAAYHKFAPITLK